MSDLEKSPLTNLTPLPPTTSSSTTPSPLETFQLLIGIQTPSSLTQNPSSSKTRQTSNIGLHARTASLARSTKLQYILTSLISNTLYMLQILLAATFTALSAYKDTQVVTLTVLGGLNTVIAGSLAWQKGQGVPQRYRKASDEYAALLLEIEMTERSFSSQNPSQPLDPHVEMARLQKLFDQARADQQANYPDLYVSTSGGSGGGAGNGVKEELEAAKKEVEEAKKVQKELLGRIEVLVGKLEGKSSVAGEEKAPIAVEEKVLKV